MSVELWLIAALSRNGVIGREGGLPWHVPEDLKLFKRFTRGHSLLMGRRTWESIGAKALPRRRNLVLSHRPAPAGSPAEFVRDLQTALELCKGEEGLFIAGGAELYALSLPLAQRLYLSRIDLQVEGDTFFPPFDESEWTETRREDYPARGNAPGFTFQLLERKA